MKKIFIIVMLFAICVIGISATKDKKLKNFEKLSQENQELVTTAYVWGIENEDKKETVEVKLVGNNNKKEENEIQKEFRIKTTRLKRLEEIKETEILP